MFLQVICLLASYQFTIISLHYHRLIVNYLQELYKNLTWILYSSSNWLSVSLTLFNEVFTSLTYPVASGELYIPLLIWRASFVLYGRKLLPISISMMPSVSSPISSFIPT